MIFDSIHWQEEPLMRRRTRLAMAAAFSVLVPLVAAPAAAQQPVERLSDINARLAAMQAPYRLEKVEWLTDSGQVGQIVFFDDRGNKQSPSHWVPFDPDRGGFRDITTIIDGTEGATTNGLTEAETTAAMERAFQTWEDVGCSTIPITNFGSFFALDLGVVQFLTGFGGVFAVLADVTHAGFLPVAFFDLPVPAERRRRSGGDLHLQLRRWLRQCQRHQQRQEGATPPSARPTTTTTTTGRSTTTSTSRRWRCTRPATA